MTAVIMILLIAGCSEGPKEKYTSLCMKFAATDEQRESCKCMAREYDKILDEREFGAISAIMDRATEEIKKPDAGERNIPGYVDYEGIDQKVLVSAMQKIRPLREARVCSNVPR